MQPKPRDLAADESVNTKTGPTEKAIKISLNGLYLCRRRPTLPHTFACSTIGPAGLNFRVRDGNGWIPRGKITDKLSCQLSAVSSQQNPAAPTFLANATDKFSKI